MSGKRGDGAPGLIDTLQGRDVASTAPTDGQVLTWDNAGSQWAPAAAGGGGASLDSLVWPYAPDGVWTPTAPFKYTDNPSIVDDTIHAYPFVVPRTMRIDDLAVWVRSGYVSDIDFTLGIYDDDGTGMEPGTLLKSQDCTFVGGQGTGLAGTTDFDYDVSQGQVIWLAFWPDQDMQVDGTRGADWSWPPCGVDVLKTFTSSPQPRWCAQASQTYATGGMPATWPGGTTYSWGTSTVVALAPNIYILPEAQP